MVNLEMVNQYLTIDILQNLKCHHVRVSFQTYIVCYCSYQFWWHCLIARYIVCWCNFLSRKFYLWFWMCYLSICSLCYCFCVMPAMCMCVCVPVCVREVIGYMYCFVISIPGSTKVVCFDVQRKCRTCEIIAV